MRQRRTLPIPAASRSPVSRALARWRSSHGRGSRIPEDLWLEAATLASQHGIHRVSQALRLNYYSLKGRVEALDTPATSAVIVAEAAQEIPAFVEVEVVPGSSPQALEVELESPTGWRMRVRSSAREMIDLAGMLQALGGSSS